MRKHLARQSRRVASRRVLSRSRSRGPPWWFPRRPAETRTSRGRAASAALFVPAAHAIDSGAAALRSCTRLELAAARRVDALDPIGDGHGSDVWSTTGCVPPRRYNRCTRSGTSSASTPLLAPCRASGHACAPRSLRIPSFAESAFLTLADGQDPLFSQGAGIEQVRLWLRPRPPWHQLSGTTTTRTSTSATVNGRDGDEFGAAKDTTPSCKDICPSARDEDAGRGACREVPHDPPAEGTVARLQCSVESGPPVIWPAARADGRRAPTGWRPGVLRRPIRCRRSTWRCRLRRHRPPPSRGASASDSAPLLLLLRAVESSDLRLDGGAAGKALKGIGTRDTRHAGTEKEPRTDRHARLPGRHAEPTVLEFPISARGFFGCVPGGIDGRS